MTRRLSRRITTALHILERSGALQLRRGKSDDVVLLRTEQGHSSSVLAFNLPTRQWRDRQTQTNGTGFFSAMRRLGIGLDVVTAALVSAAGEDTKA